MPEKPTRRGWLRGLVSGLFGAGAARASPPRPAGGATPRPPPGPLATSTSLGGGVPHALGRTVTCVCDGTAQGPPNPPATSRGKGAARPAPPPARAFPPHVEALARACYDALPSAGGEYLVLADALEEAGEADAAAHCREGPHARGCCVLDWVLGRAEAGARRASRPAQARER